MYSNLIQWTCIWNKKNKVKNNYKAAEHSRFLIFNSLLCFRHLSWRERFGTYVTSEVYDAMTIQADDNCMNMWTISEDAKEGSDGIIRNWCRNLETDEYVRYCSQKTVETSEIASD